jgi:hypothetical protein
MEIFKEYEGKMENILLAFAAEEKCEAHELMRRLRGAADAIPQAEKNIQILLAATEFNKFARLMRMKAKVFRKAEAAKELVAAMKS